MVGNFMSLKQGKGWRETTLSMVDLKVQGGRSTEVCRSEGHGRCCNAAWVLSPTCPGLFDFIGVPLGQAWTRAGGNSLRDTKAAGPWCAGHPETHPKNHIAESVASRQVLLWPVPSTQEVPPASSLLPATSSTRSLPLSCASLGRPASLPAGQTAFQVLCA